MQNLIMSFNVIFPIFVNLSLGYFLKFIKIFDEDGVRVLNTSVFKVFLPILLFYNIYKTNISSSLNLKLIIFSIFAIAIPFLLLSALVPIFVKSNKKRGALIQGIFRSNFVLFGLPVVMSIYPDQSIGVTAMLTAFIVPVYNILAVVCLEYWRGGKPSFRTILIGIIKNPLIVASILGLIFVGFNIKFPNIIEKSIISISAIASPLSLISLGAFFTFKSIKGYGKYIITGVLGRLVVYPLLVIPAAIMLGFRGIELTSIMIFSAAPTAVASYVMSEQMDSDSTLAGQLVVIGSIASIFTVFLWVWALKSLGVI